ncbi:ASCH domain-containing protein [Dermatophilus congolensis]|uniref:ASCH domain n=1 Tax=Dermatophilus congolensis TaxID=1863 RepID=A0A239VHD6_9MICO|nr:ASCH domain-containing protein [Dermatophilus congolensis]SNV21108.1 ASCH domain [Dermatophilus congolensis]
MQVEEGQHLLEDAQGEKIEAFWEEAKLRAMLNPVPVVFGPNAGDSLRPPAWAFGTSAEEADLAVQLILQGKKTATAAAAWDYELAGTDLPQVGAMGIVLDGVGDPRALVVTTQVRVVRFDEVDAEHVRAEGEGDGAVSSWKRTRRREFVDQAVHGRDFAEDMPVVLERFRVLFP